MSPQFTRDNKAAADVLAKARERLKRERGLTIYRAVGCDSAVTVIAFEASLWELASTRGPVTTWDRIAATCRAERKLRGMG